MNNITNTKLYSGNAKKSCLAECPECGTKYTLFLKPIHQSYKVLGIQKFKSKEEETTKFICEDCQREFNTEHGLKVHRNQKHKS